LKFPNTPSTTPKNCIELLGFVADVWAVTKR
jgi:hypothetical protein